MTTTTEPYGWTEDEAYAALNHDAKSMDGPVCPWHGPAQVLPSKSYSTRRPLMVTRIGWRCRHRDCGNRWGWRWWLPQGLTEPQRKTFDRRKLCHSRTDCWCGMPHRPEDFLPEESG